MEHVVEGFEGGAPRELDGPARVPHGLAEERDDRDGFAGAVVEHLRQVVLVVRAGLVVVVVGEVVVLETLAVLQVVSEVP